MYFVVAGAGEVGFHLSQALLESGHEVTVIEADRRRANFVQERLGSVVPRWRRVAVAPTRSSQ